ncbi:FAAR089Cp [Eremothecium gossypii FDAG1]|nr:FAAR089Cp [Eremothecium gossypii FDAG1]
MAREKEVLNVINLNTPIMRNSWTGAAGGTTKHEKPLVEAFNSSTNRLHFVDRLPFDVTEGFREVQRFVQEGKGEADKVREALTGLYRELKQRHQLGRVAEVSRQHMGVVVRLLEAGQDAAAAREVVALYNQTNYRPAGGLGDVLMADFGVSNERYLSTAKILAMQLIIRMRQVESHAETVVRIFAADERYILRDPKLKVHTVVKLILNFFSLLPQYKVLFALKFLQYVSQFRLDFSTYIKNMDLAKFQKQVLKFAGAGLESSLPFLDIYYRSYSQHMTSIGKLMWQDFRVPDRGDTKLNPEDPIILQQILHGRRTLDNAEFDAYTKHITTKLSKGVSPTDAFLGALKVYILNCSLKRLRLQKAHVILLDKIAIFINTNVVHVSVESIHTILKSLAEYFIDAKEYKRLNNVVNISFNAYVMYKHESLIRLAADLELFLFMSVKQDWSMFTKFEKFISVASGDISVSLFEQCFNVYVMFADPSLAGLWDVCLNKSLKCFKKLGLTSYTDFKASSEPMLVLVYSGFVSDIFTIPYNGWAPLSKMLFMALNGVYKFGYMDVDCKIKSVDVLAKYEMLIKSTYSLNMEMETHGTLQLSKIANMYVSRWVSSLPTDERISGLEVRFVKALVQYLRFNKFHKKLIELCQLLKSKGEYYESFKNDIRVWLLEAYTALKMVQATKLQIQSVLKIHSSFSIERATFDSLYEYLYARLLIISWERDNDSFNHLVQELRVSQTNFFDINNNSNLPVSQFLKLLLLNIRIEKLASLLQFHNNNMFESLLEAKKALKLCQSLIKKQQKLSQFHRLEVISLLQDLFAQVIGIYIQVGVSKDCEFYVKDFMRVVGELQDWTPIYDCLCFVYDYYKLTEQNQLASATLSRLNRTFDMLDGSENIDALAKFMYYNDEPDKLRNSLALFFSGDLEDTFLVDEWNLRLGIVIENTREQPQLKALSDVNKSNELYLRILKQMELDPFFSNMCESVIAIPSCFSPKVEEIRPAVSNVWSPAGSPYHSPRPSSLTPRGKCLRQKFDRSNAINNLQMIKRLIESVNLDEMQNHEVSKTSCLYSLSLSFLSNISSKTDFRHALIKRFTMAELPKYMPMYYDKMFSRMGNEVYGSFMPMEVKSMCTPFFTVQQKVDGIQTNFNSWDEPFQAISVDICKYNGDLLLSKVVSTTGKHFHLRLPLNRHESRDLSQETLTFALLMEELNDIIEKNNRTTSIEVTSVIKTKEDRREWWEERYSLDKRMCDLMRRIEDSWICGFCGFFSQKQLDKNHFALFKLGFQKVLQQNLPTRRQYGNPSMFLQVDDFILELFLKVDWDALPHEKKVDFMEDLIYFIFDILLFHGEENAYDEIDVHLIHIQLEELIHDYHAKAPEAPRLGHTFLVISSECSLVPWESLSIFSDASVSRVPSINFLHELLTKFRGEISPKINLDSRLSIVLNPHGDLTRTELRFKEHFTRLCCDLGSTRIVTGSKPEEDEFVRMITNSSTFIYIGHGGGEQYFRSKTLKLQDNAAPSFLLGCSSAYMKQYGKLEPSSVLYSYLLGGSPMVIGNLWDVTDKDIDAFTEAMFQKLGIFPSQRDRFLNVSEAVSSSRDVCHLRYLNGAAPVVYGLPFRYNTTEPMLPGKGY